MSEPFWWGTTSASTSCEGAAPASDWAAWERDGRVPPSGDGNGFAVEHAADLARLAGAGLPHHRLTLEWARLEPEPGRRDGDAVDHYRRVLTAARDAGIAPWACLHHVSLPGWFSIDERGFPDERSRGYYWPRHVDFVAEAFGDLVEGWTPVHDPYGYAVGGFLTGVAPPGRREPRLFAEALEATHLADLDAARRLRQTGRPVLAVRTVSPLTPADATPEAEVVTGRIDRAMWGCWIEALRDGVLAVPGRAPIESPAMQEAIDLVGISYFGAAAVGADGQVGPYPPDARVGALGYAPWSEGLGLVLHRLAEELPGLPLVVADHGVGTDDDGWRAEVLRDSLAQVAGAVADGIEVRGFFHRSAVDGYEWQHGFDVPFGLWDRDRTPRTGSLDVLRTARHALS